MTQLQELEATIRQRRQYLQGQDNQVQRNLKLLQSQQSLLKANKAQLALQNSKLTSLTVDSEKALKRLQKRAEDKPSQRFLELTNQCQDLRRTIQALELQQANLDQAIRADEDSLEQLDHEIIEADAVQKLVNQKVVDAKQRLYKAQRDAEFQSGVVSNLQYDIDKLNKQLNGASNLKLALEKDQDRVAREINQQNQVLTNLTNSIDDKQVELKALNKQLTITTKSLKQLTDKDKHFRKGLAEEKQKLDREKEDLQISKQALKKELNVQKQLNPKFKLKVSDEPHHFKI